jgi:hydrogenase expression/formation protein HypE
MPALAVGKLPPQLLERLLGKVAPTDPRVVMGPRLGEDAAVLDMGDRYLVATADPITFATDEAGWYALHVNANDIAVRGARPTWFLATVLLPEGAATEATVERLFADLGEACAELGVALIGGHTEVTAGLPRAIVSGCMLGEVEKDRLVTTGGARPGDTLLLTKGVPLEGAAIVARERAAEAGRRGVAANVVKRAQEFLRRPGISVVPEARAACGAARVHAMHDPTEGGVATACWELAQAADVGLRVDRERVPVLREGRVLCEAFGLDPLGTIASGSLLLAVDPDDAEAVIMACRGAGVDCAAIGRVTDASQGVSLVTGGHARPMPTFPQDEITRIFSEG